MTNKRTYNTNIVIAIALLLLIVSGSSGWYLLPAFADTERNTSALTDLQKDEAFNIDEYPDNAADYSIQLIQIAESTDGGLVVYTYQPCQKTTYLVATEINMSQSESVDGTLPYGLTLLNSDGVFCKYKVNDITVSVEATRYYNISSIFRDFINGIDKETGNDNTTDAVAFDVGKLYKATTDENGKISYTYEIKDTVEIIDPYAGFLEYFNGFKFCSWSHCHSHFVSFSTDWAIDSLKEADVTYFAQKCYYHYSMSSGAWTSKDNPVKDIVTVKGEEKGSNEADGFLGKQYEWARIQTVDEFINSESLTDEVKQGVKGKQWVLRFLETPYVESSTGVSSSDSWTELSKVTVLRLEFYKNGRLYNLGAVSDKVTGSGKPGNTNTDETASIWEWLERVTGIPQWVWIMLAALIPLAILLPVLSFIFPVVGQVLLIALKAIGKAFLWLLRGLWWLICLPFKWIYRKIRGE